MKTLLFKAVFILAVLVAAATADGSEEWTKVDEPGTILKICHMDSMIDLVDGTMYSYTCSVFMYACMFSPPEREFKICRNAWFDSLNRKGDPK